MKKFFLFFLIAMGGIACKKSKVTPPDTNGSITGNWSISSYTDNYYDINNNYLASENIHIINLTFNDDGTITVFSDEAPPYSNYTYTISDTNGKKHITFALTNTPFTHFNILGIATYEVITLNDHQLALKTDPFPDGAPENVNGVVINSVVIKLTATR